ncbi:MAG: hypothetical protein KDD47_15105, partial [Acidobacteria bacterium]|nr:hypothetical protein [Acidobacteriota bacterium]
ARVLEGLSSRWRLGLHSGGGSAAGAGTLAELQAEAEVGGFQILLGTFFADFSQLATHLNLEAALTAASPGRSPDLRGGLRWQLEDGTALTAGILLEGTETGESHRPVGSVSAATGPVHATLDLKVEDLEGLLDRHLRAPLLDASERFATLQTQGSLHMRLKGLRGTDGRLELEGRLLTENLDLAGLGPARLQDFRLELPFALRKPADASWMPGETRAGTVSFSGLSVQGLALEQAEAPLSITGDSVALRRPLVLPFAGGRLVLEDLSLVGLAGPAPYLETAIEIDGLELEALAAGLGGLPLEGRIDGRLPRIRLDGSHLEVDGGGQVQLFGGTVSVGDISGQDLLSRYPKLVFSADFQDLDLGRITRRFDFGEMSGILQGSLENCEIFRSVPVRCKGRFETVERKGVPRSISVKAVNNIAILGTGQSAGFLDRGITRFFDRYTYSRLGVEMSLAQDVFLLRGLESRRGKELFLKGRLPFPIDVVNAQPGRTVSFQTMLRRLRSLDFGQAVTKPP